MTVRASRLMADIESAVVDSSIPLADVLRKAIALGGKSGSTELRDWAMKEIQGYGVEDELPEFRKIIAPLAIDGMRFNSIIRGQRISVIDLPDFAQDDLQGPVQLRMGVAEMERAIKSCKPGDSIHLMHPGAAELVQYMNGTGKWTGHIERLYWCVSPVAFHGVLETIRTGLTVLVAEIESNNPAGAVVPPAEVATNAVTFDVSGKRNKVTVGHTGGVHVTQTEVAAEEPKAKWWKIVGGVLGGLLTIAGVVFALMQAQGWQF